MKLLLKGGSVYTGGKFIQADVLIGDGIVERVGDCGEVPEGTEVLQLGGAIVAPGFVDVHVHLREPGFSYKETIAEGSRGAARGGYTTVFSMPNLNPAPDSVENLRAQLDIIKDTAVVKVIPYGTITKGQKGTGELSDMKAMKEHVAGFSDDGRGVQAGELMEQAMKLAAQAGRPIVAHCEVDELLHGGYIHDGEYARAHGHKGICSESEWRQVERDIELARATGCQYHVCHVSTTESVDLVRKAREEGLAVSCEVSPHHLLLDETMMSEDGRFKMNPPLRSTADRQALIDGLKDGTIEVIATDHAPHSAEEKSRGLAGSAMGIVGLETAFPVLYTKLVREGVISLEKLIELMAVAPRRLFGLPNDGIKAGAQADITVIDTETEYTIAPDTFLSKGKCTPFEGWQVRGRTLLTLVDGEAAYSDGTLMTAK